MPSSSVKTGGAKKQPVTKKRSTPGASEQPESSREEVLRKLTGQSGDDRSTRLTPAQRRELARRAARTQAQGGPVSKPVGK